MRISHCFVLSALLIAAIPLSAALPPKTSGSAFCTGTELKPEACRISWKWDVTPRGGQWIQVFDTEIKNWRMIAELPNSPTGTSIDAVESGKLYRVRSCDDPSVATTCIDTTVVWATLRPAIDEIPPAVVTDKGNIVQISKNLPYGQQGSQLNGAQLEMTFHDIDMTQMPAMTPPERRWGAKNFQQIDNVLNNVYDWYQGSRLPRPVEDEEAADSEHEGQIPIEWIGDVPPAKQNDYRAAHLYGGGFEDSLIIFEPSVPKYTVTIFADIGCEHCSRIVRDLDDLNARGIRVRFAAFPLHGPYSAEGRKMKGIWCAPDRKGALKQAFLGEAVESQTCDDQTVLLQYALSKKLGFSGSPTLVAGTGEIIGGYLTPDELEHALKGL